MTNRNPFNRFSHSCKGINTKSVELPQSPLYGTPEWNAKFNQQLLTVPNQDIPYDFENSCSTVRFLGKTTIALPDGTVLDLDKCRVVSKSTRRCAQDEWAPIKDVSSPYDVSMAFPSMTQMNDEFSELISGNTTKIFSSIDPSVSINKEDAEYWLKAEEEAEKMIAEMTPDQKKMISDFENHFPKSRLIDECAQLKKNHHYKNL